MLFTEYNEEVHIKNEKKISCNEGINVGEEIKLIKLVCKKMTKGKNPKQIADDLEEEEAYAQKIYEVALQYGPDYNPDRIYEDLYGKNELLN